MIIILHKLSIKAYCKIEIVFIFLNDHIPDQFFAVRQKKNIMLHPWIRLILNYAFVQKVKTASFRTITVA